MKTNIPVVLRKREIAAVILMILFSSASAQNYKQKLKSYQNYSSNYSIVGATVSIGTSTYNFKSDIDRLNELKVLAEGWNTELILGNNQFKIRGGFGKYHFDAGSNESIDQTLFSGKLNVSPNGFFGRSKYVRFYVLTGFDYNIYNLKGITINTPQSDDELGAAVNKRKGKARCICPAPGNSNISSGQIAAGSPLQLTPISIEEDKKSFDGSSPSAEIKKGQINGGVGLEINIPKEGFLFRLYGEGYYGIPMSEVIENIGLAKTQVSPLLMINFGIGVGLGR